MAMLNNQRVTFWGLEWNSSWILDLCDTKWSKFSIVFSDLRTCVFHRQELPRQTPLFFGIHWHPHLSGPFFAVLLLLLPHFFPFQSLDFLVKPTCLLPPVKSKNTPNMPFRWMMFVTKDPDVHPSQCELYLCQKLHQTYHLHWKLQGPIDPTKHGESHLFFHLCQKPQTSSYIIIKSPWNAS